MMKTQLLSFGLVFALLMIAPVTVTADDLNPADYRGSSLTVEAHWDFNAPPNITFELPDSFNAIGGSGFQLYNQFQTHIDFGSSSDWQWDGMSGVTAVNPNGSSFAINAQNWVDDLPLKLARVQLSYTGASPSIVSAVGVELAGTAGEFDVIGTPLFNFDDGMNRYEDWQFSPNPDWEQFVVSVPFGTTIGQVDFDSISIPEPTGGLIILATFALAASRRNKLS